MSRPYTSKDFKTDSTVGLLNGLFFSSIYSFYNLALNKPYQPTLPWKAKSKIIRNAYLVSTSKLCLVFLGAHLVHGYTKRKQFEAHYAFALAAGTGFLLLTLLRM